MIDHLATIGVIVFFILVAFLFIKYFVIIIASIIVIAIIGFLVMIYTAIHDEVKAVIKPKPNVNMDKVESIIRKYQD